MISSVHRYQIVSHMYVLLYSQVPVCVTCGNLLSVSTEKFNSIEGKDLQRNFVCQLCKSSDNVQVIAVPYVFKYLVVELAAMSIRVDLKVTDLLR